MMVAARKAATLTTSCTSPTCQIWLAVLCARDTRINKKLPPTETLRNHPVPQKTGSKKLAIHQACMSPSTSFKCSRTHSGVTCLTPSIGGGQNPPSCCQNIYGYCKLAKTPPRQICWQKSVSPLILRDKANWDLSEGCVWSLRRFSINGLHLLIGTPTRQYGQHTLDKWSKTAADTKILHRPHKILQ